MRLRWVGLPQRPAPSRQTAPPTGMPGDSGSSQASLQVCLPVLTWVWGWYGLPWAVAIPILSHSSFTAPSNSLPLSL